ncbi:TolC family outer membrane protein [Pseudomonas syringae]|nr:TolC family outer membrane protein [Pseudomonas syringae]MBD8793094.1 TolC family outer membrane protein [Pseudomonas syringae]MBD8803773.1 TolC family outer membrane protein [Pseudomonas syringae]MBD8814266.1 TolC family outer membrane protein [Pseudomonas syringae]
MQDSRPVPALPEPPLSRTRPVQTHDARPFPAASEPAARRPERVRHADAGAVTVVPQPPASRFDGAGQQTAPREAAAPQPSAPTPHPAPVQDRPSRAAAAQPPVPRAASAPTGQRLSLDEAVRQAVGWHPDIAQAVSTLYQQGEGINVAEAGYYPQITGGIRGGMDTGYGSDRNSQAMSISLKQMLYDFGKVDNAVEAARARVARSQAQILLSIDQIARDTAYAWVEVQRYRHLSEIARKQIQGVGDIVELARQRSEMGASTRSDLVQAQSRAEGAMASLEDYKAQYARWQATLSNLMGRTTTAEMADEFPQESMTACSRSQPATDILPAVLVAQAQRTQAEAELAGARADAYPTLSLEPTVNHYLDSGYNDNNPAIDRTQAGIYLNFEVPIYQGGATSARSRAAGHALSAADAAQDAALLQASQGLAEARAQTSSLALRLNALQRRQGSISEARELYGRQYLDLGTRPLLDLLNAEQEIHQSRFELAGTQADLRRLQIDCLYNSGGLRRAFDLEARTVQGVRILP